MLKPKSALRKDRRSAYAPLEHRHFATIAAIILEAPPSARPAMASHFADRLYMTNPRFDRERFLAACEKE